MSKHYQALADKAAVHASYAETESDKLYWMSWCQHYTDAAPTIPPRQGDRFDAALYYGATIAAVAALLAGGSAVGYLIALWLFN